MTSRVYKLTCHFLRKINLNIILILNVNYFINKMEKLNDE